ncbi:MAG: DUF4476 domain-containing protein [Crocinitomicaceae bacterium]|nr:DUF4476 domain-containing protein [Crocinitomicaceae bacterium]
MKTLVTFLIILIVSAANAQNCLTPVSNQVFQQNYTQIATQPTEQKKLDKGIAFTSINCVSSNQVKLIALLFATEQSRLDFCKLSYHMVSDKENFYDVYDAFQQFSTAFKLHDYVLEQKGKYTAKPIPNPIANPPVVTQKLLFPALNYPSHLGYQGPTGCGNPIPEGEFMALAVNVNSYQKENEKLIAANVVAEENCISMAQAMKLATLFSDELTAIKFMKNAFEYIHDQANYPSATQCFKTEPVKQDWLSFCAEYLLPPCIVKEEQSKTMLKQIDDAAFKDKQIEIVKALNSNHCFSTAQVKRIMSEFSFPENKLDVAQILYPKCTDRENYYQLKGSFSFPQYESEFQDMISGN